MKGETSKDLSIFVFFMSTKRPMTIFQIAEVTVPVLSVIVTPFYLKWFSSKPDLTLKGVIIRVLLNPWIFPGIQVASGLFSVWTDYHRTAPVTPAFVVTAACDVASVLLGIFFYFMLSMVEIVSSIRISMSRVIEVEGDIIDALKTVGKGTDRI